MIDRVTGCRRGSPTAARGSRRRSGAARRGRGRRSETRSGSRRSAGRRRGRCRRRARRGCPGRSASIAASIRPTIGMPIARATIVTCAVSEPSSRITPRSLRRSYSSSSAAPRLRATRIVSSGSPVGSWLSALPIRWRSSRFGEPSRSMQPLAQIRDRWHARCATRVSSWTGAPPPRRRARCRSPRACGAASRDPGRTCGRLRAPRDARRPPIAGGAAAGRALRAGPSHRPLEPLQLGCRLSASRRVTSTRGWCSTAWPIATPSTRREPVQAVRPGRRRSSSAAYVGASISSPEANISASTDRDDLQRLDLLLVVVRARVRFCTTSTPTTRPPCRIGTPRKD